MSTTTNSTARGPLEAAFAKQLVNAMSDASVTSAQLAKAISVTSSAISNYVQGRHLPKNDSRQKMEAVLGVEFVMNDAKADRAKKITNQPQAKIHAPLTMADAKAGLAMHYGVPPEDITITIKG